MTFSDRFTFQRTALCASFQNLSRRVFSGLILAGNYRNIWLCIRFAIGKNHKDDAYKQTAEYSQRYHACGKYNTGGYGLC